jgi:hypothetical protein
MATMVLDPYAYELDALKERRRPIERSATIALGPTELAELIDWP